MSYEYSSSHPAFTPVFNNSYLLHIKLVQLIDFSVIFMAKYKRAA